MYYRKLYSESLGAHIELYLLMSSLDLPYRRAEPSCLHPQSMNITSQSVRGPKDAPRGPIRASTVRCCTCIVRYIDGESSEYNAKCIEFGRHKDHALTIIAFVMCIAKVSPSCGKKTLFMGRPT